VSGNNKTYSGGLAKRPIPLSEFSNFGVSDQTCTEVPNTKFHGNPTSGSRADTSGQRSRTWLCE